MFREVEKTSGYMCVFPGSWSIAERVERDGGGAGGAGGGGSKFLSEGVRGTVGFQGGCRVVSSVCVGGKVVTRQPAIKERG